VRIIMKADYLNRREFAGRIAAGAAVPLIAGGATGEAAQPAQKPDESKPPSPVERMLALIRQQYPDPRLDDSGIAEIREELEAQVARSARLSAYPLTNADEPGFVFRAYRQEGEERR
ncbi:MAG: hypothetical protein ACM3U2_10610, partial [Deltaproteobacteria bacterium]